MNWLPLLVMLWASPAEAQNTTCATRAAGDNTNACATTAFVTTAIAAIPSSTLNANSILGNATAGSATGTSLAMPSCSTSASALLYTTNTGFSCNSAVNAATLGGATFAAPGAIGGGTPAAGTFTTLSGTTSVTGGTGSFTTLAASSTVSGTGFSDYLASPPAIGGTAPAAVKATTVWITGHLFTTGTAPSASSCGTSPSVNANSTDVAGKVTTGSSTGTACTLTFASAWTTAPFCQIAAENGATLPYITASTTAISITNSSNSSTYTYFCIGKS
jgi:hypothetical protein